MTHLDYEEQYHKKGERRAERKFRKETSRRDRSKYKKTDRDKRAEKAPPDDDNLIRGRVLAITGEGILVDAAHVEYYCSLKGALKKERTEARNLIAVGDFVLFDPKENLIHYVEERRSYLSRREHYKGNREQLLAVNIDQVFIVVSLHAPPLKPALIDRYIIATKKGGMQPLIVINKIDQLSRLSPDEKALFDDCLKAYEELHIPLLLVSASEKVGLDQIKKLMQNRASVFSGQSGVGKTSLINEILGLNLTIGDIVEKTRKGAHTTTTARLIPIEGEGFCIDTPGIKSFGLWDLTAQEIQNYFPEIAALSASCKFPNCTHTHEPNCAVISALENQTISRLRYDSYCNLMQEIK